MIMKHCVVVGLGKSMPLLVHVIFCSLKNSIVHLWKFSLTVTLIKQWTVRGRYVKFDMEIEHILCIVYEIVLVINNNKHGDSMELGYMWQVEHRTCTYVKKFFIKIK